MDSSVTDQSRDRSVHSRAALLQHSNPDLGTRASVGDDGCCIEDTDLTNTLTHSQNIEKVTFG